MLITHHSLRITFFMAYQVIARKWRPQTFAEVTGQEHITRTLRNAIEHERLHHAYLFSGARGVGKTTTARLLAKALNCHRAERPTPTPCRTTDETACASCREIAEGRSIDVQEIDAASNTGVDNVREAIIGNVAVRPARDRYKVFIIDEVHMLSGAAFNALLKTLEEPPPRVVFIMATTELHKVPETILSRCQQFEFRTIPTRLIADRLRLIAAAEQIRVTDEALSEIAREGCGSMRDAQSAFDQVISFSDGEITVEDVEAALGIASAEMLARTVGAIAEGKIAEIFVIVNELITRGQDLRNFCRDLLAYLRDLLVLKVAGNQEASLDRAETERRDLLRAADCFSESELVRFFHSLTETENNLRLSAQPRYQLEIGLVKLIEMRRLAPLGQVMERLAALEEALRSGKPATSGGTAPPPAVSGSAVRRGSASSTPPSSADSAVKPAGEKGAGEAEGAQAHAAAAPHGGSTLPPVYPPLTLVPPSAGKTGATATPSSLGPAAREDRVGPSVPASAALTGSLAGQIKQMLDRRSRPLLVIALDGARRVEIEGDDLCIEFAPEMKHLRNSLATPESSRLLREIGRELTGRNLGLRISVGAEDGPPSRETEQKREEQLLREKAEQHPVVQKFLNTFRGEILEVRRVEAEGE
jgi:DNA polymerase-3 subunit gamma/tau